MLLFPDSQGLGENLFQPGTTLGGGGGGELQSQGLGLLFSCEHQTTKEEGQSPGDDPVGGLGRPLDGLISELRPEA